MRSKSFIIALLFLISSGLHSLWASTCYMSLTLKDPKLASNEKLWADFEKEIKAGTPEHLAIEKVYKKHSTSQNHEKLEEAPKTKSSVELVIAKKAQIEINKLPPNLKKKTDEFIELISSKNGLHEIRTNPGRWNFEQLNYAKDAYSIRLNGGYRILFELKNDQLNIKEVNKNDIHKK